MGLLGTRQWDWHCPGIHGTYLPHLSALAWQGEVSGYWHWPGRLQEDCEISWRPHLGRVGGRQGGDILLYVAGGGGEEGLRMSGVGEVIEVLLGEDNPRNMQFVKEVLKEAGSNR
jgi:hypothetical protein